MRAYSKDVLNSCICYLNTQDYSYILDKENGVISFVIKDVFDFLLEIDEQSFVLSTKLPICFDDRKTDVVSSYIFLINANPMFAHFTIDYETKEIYCVYGAFCDGKEVEPAILDDAIESVVVCIKSFYDGFVDIVENDTSAKEAYEKIYA